MIDQKSGTRGADDSNLMDEPAAPAQSGTNGGNTARDVASRDEERTALGSDPKPTRVTKQDKTQPDTATRSDHQGAQS